MITHFHDYSLTPFSNDLSDHDAQILIIKNLCQSQYDRTLSLSMTELSVSVWQNCQSQYDRSVSLSITELSVSVWQNCQSQYDRTKTVRKVDQHTISDFIDKLNKESWDSTFNNTDVNLMFNPLNAELNPICYLLALLAHHFLHLSRIRDKLLTLRLLMSYI